jgi:hypothetical protein
MEDVNEKEYISEDESDGANNNKDGKVDISEETLIEFAREVTKRLEITKRYEYDILKLKLEHELEIKKHGYCNLM